MIKLNKKTAVPYLKARLSKIYEVTHYYGDSYDTDLMIRIGKKREYLDDEAINVNIRMDKKSKIRMYKKYSYVT